MAWDSDLQIFGAQQEAAYTLWSALNTDEFLEPPELRNTKPGYHRWVERTSREDPELYARARAHFDTINPFADHFVELSWKPGPIKRDKKIKAPAMSLWVFAGEPVPETFTYRDGKAVGGYRTVPVTETTGTVGDYDNAVSDQEKEHEVWGDEIAADRARANAMMAEAKGDRSVLIATLAVKVAPAPAAPPAKVPEPV